MHLKHDWSFSELLIRVALSWKGGKMVLHSEEVRSGIMILFSDSNGRCAKVLQTWHLVLLLCCRWVLQSGFPGEEFAVMARKELTEVYIQGHLTHGIYTLRLSPPINRVVMFRTDAV